jgi:hypothetical protein
MDRACPGAEGGNRPRSCAITPRRHFAPTGQPILQQYDDEDDTSLTTELCYAVATARTDSKDRARTAGGLIRCRRVCFPPTRATGRQARWGVVLPAGPVRCAPGIHRRLRPRRAGVCALPGPSDAGCRRLGRPTGGLHGRVVHRRELCLTNPSLDRARQLLWRDRLGHMVIHAGIEALLPVSLLQVLRGDTDGPAHHPCLLL